MMQGKRFKESAMQRGGRGLLKTGIYLIVALVSFYGDAVFVWLNISHYSGPLAWIFQVFLILGAFCTSASIMFLLFGKASWFTPGAQLILAYVFTGIEVIVNVLNIVIALNPNLGIVELWRIFSPATPFVALVGWVIILSVDSEQRARHKEMEMAEDKRDAEREYEMMVHESSMDLKIKYLEQTKQKLQARLNSSQAQQIINQHADNLTAQVLNEITGLPVMPQEPQRTQRWYTPQEDGGSAPIDLPYTQADQDFHDAFGQHMDRIRQQQQPSPLQQPPLNTQAHQAGTNGNK